MCIVDGVKTVIVCLAAIAVTACGGTAAAQQHATPVPAAVAASRASADCSKLTAALLPSVAYDQLVTDAVSRAAHGGDATAAQVRTAKAAVAAEIRAACPAFAYLAR